MKNNSLLIFLYCAVSSLLVSCGVDEVTQTLYAPTLTLSSTAITATSEEGAYSFTYTVRNPAEDGQVTCACAADWIEDLEWTDGRTVNFTVSENLGLNTRLAQISVTYSSSFGYVEQIVTVAQNSSQTPAITVSPTGIVADIDGGSYSFGYTITNPTIDGRMDIGADVSWITDISDAGEGTVNFSVNTNTEAEIREGVITVTYSYGTDAQSEIVTVVQDGYDQSGVSEIEGTYKCTGIVYNHSWDQTIATEPGISATWTLKIYDNGNGTVTLSGLLPDIVDLYPDYTSAYIAKGTVSGHSIMVYPQYTGYFNSLNNGYICWLLGKYYSNEEAYDTYDPGWYHTSVSYWPCTFTYASATDSWVSDYGMFLGSASKSNDLSSFFSFYNVFAQGMSFTKISNSTSSVSETSEVGFDENAAFTDFLPFEIGGDDINFKDERK